MEVLRRVSIPSVNQKKTRLSYSITFKLAAVRHAELHGNRATARYLGINEKQIRDWRSKKFYLLNTNANAKRLKGAGRQVTDTKREQDLKIWIDEEQRNGRYISHFEVQEKAKVLSTKDDFKASSGWLRRWKIRHNFPLDKPILGINNNDVALNNNNTVFMNNYMLPIYHTILPTPTDACAMLPPFKSPEDEDFEFREKISCAIALLELKSSNTHSPTDL